jgi:ABC-type multidrug transport system fused ATPase/permease subunit
MIEIYKNLYSLLDVKQKKAIITLQIFNIILTILEVISLVLVVLFISSINDVEKVINNKFFLKLINLLNLNSILYSSNLIFFLGILTFLSYLITTIVSVFINISTNKTGQQISQSFAFSLYNYFISRNWIFFSKMNISEINSNLFSDLTVVNNYLVVPSVNLLSKMFTSFAIVLTVIFINPFIAITGCFFFIFFYGITIFFIKKITKKYAKFLSKIRHLQFKLINDTFFGFKEVIFYNLKQSYKVFFDHNSQSLVKPESTMLSLQNLPKTLIEFITYSFIIFFILFFFALDKNYSSTILNSLTIYAFAGLKLIPAFQQIYLTILRSKTATHSYNIVIDKLKESRKKIKDRSIDFDDSELPFKNISLKNISFGYGKKNYLKNINLHIKKNQIIGFAGYTASGKTTLVDLISGLIYPRSGTFLIDKKKLEKKDTIKWINNFSIVHQNPYILNETILENITFSKILKAKVNYIRLKESLKISRLERFIAKLPKGIHSIISERGLNISGGEKQRIVIARAIYFNKNIIIFDEATNSLDTKTELEIIDMLKNLSNKKTIIMITHRISTLKICDKIFLLDKGKIVKRGSLAYLNKNSNYFKKINK